MDHLNGFGSRVFEETRHNVYPVDLHTMQVNVGLRCNQTCLHCHLEAGPARNELMAEATMRSLSRLADATGFEAVDITGGAPELNPDIKGFISDLSSRGMHVMVRTNLTVLLETGLEDMADFYQNQGVELIASLPCYLEEEVAEQRGRGIFEKSINALRLLNELGYGSGDLQLNLVYNPLGAFLPPPQKALEDEYRKELGAVHGVFFNKLFTIANMPIGRFRSGLEHRGEFGRYMSLLRDSFNPATLDSLMCRHQINVGWDGKLYDCDFNQALGLTADVAAGGLDSRAALLSRRIRTGDHCFGCTAGAGSSCGGALVV